MNEITISLKSKIFSLNGKNYVLDVDLAVFYGMKTKHFNELIKRNLNRFDDDFIKQLSKEELEMLKKEGSIENHIGKTYLPYAFTLEGTVLLCGLLNTETAIEKAKYVAKEFVRLKFLEFEALQNELKILKGSNSNDEIDALKKEISKIKEDFLLRQEFAFFAEKMIKFIDNKEGQNKTIGFIPNSLKNE